MSAERQKQGGILAMRGKLVRIILSVLLVLVMTFGLLPMGTSTSFADAVVIDIGTISEGGTGYTYSGNTVTITTSGTYTITGTTTINKVIVASGVEASITLDAVSIDVSQESYSCALALAGMAKAIITLEGDNILTSGQGCAGLRVPVDAHVTIGGSGSLRATGGWNSAMPTPLHLQGAGIGGDQGHKDSGAIEITGGTIIASGGASAAGIGSCIQSTSAVGDFSSIIISGGNVTANGGVEAAGIGGVKDGKGGTISISGGATVNASTRDLIWQCPDIGAQEGQPSTLLVDGNAVLNLLQKGLHVTTFFPGSCTIQGPAAGSYLGVYAGGIKQPISINMSTVNSSGLGYTYSDAPAEGCKVTLTADDNYHITGSTTSTSLEVDYRVQNVNITLENATIDVTSCKDGENALTLTGSTTANLTLRGTNTLKGACSGAALAVPKNATLTIGGDGTLNAIGGVHSAGIGASPNFYADAGTIAITGGTINAQGGEGAAGIGGGCSGGMSGVSDWARGGQVTITGGHVTAAGGQGSTWAGGKDPAAIGGGTNGSDFQGSGGTLLVDGGAIVTLNAGGTNASWGFVTCTIDGTGAGDLAGHYEDGVKTGSIALISIAPPADITGVGNGADKTAAALGLPVTVSVQTSAGANTAEVTWNVDACSYDSAVTTEQIFSVSGTVTLPSGILNPNNVPLTTSINVTVNAQAVQLNPIITSITAVSNVEVAYGTAETVALATLAATTTITDSNNDTHTVNLSWGIASYAGNTAGNYTAIGTFALPAGVDQSDPETELKVTATVTVNAAAPAPTYPLIITAATGGSITNGSSGDYAAGTVITITATPGSGYSFNKWTSTGGGTFANANNSSTAYTMPVNSAEITASFTYQGSGGGTPGGDTGDSSTGGGGTGESSTGGGDTTPTIAATLTAGTYEKSLDVHINKTDGSVLISLDEGIVNEAFDRAEADSNGKKTICLDAPEVQGVNSSILELPVAFLSSESADRYIEMASEVGVITLPSNMLEGMQFEGTRDVSISIGQGDKSALPDEVQRAIGDRPLVQLNLSLDGVATEWNNPDAPVTVSIPYEPTAEELKVPEYIVVWYIDGSGNVVSVPSGRYDPATGTVTFTTTHFSHYAIAYEHKTFADLGKVTWAKPSIEVLASKDIVRGVSEKEYFPQDSITRADFLCFLVRTLGLETRFASNFDDIGEDACYYREIGVAKKLGITHGTGNNKFSPDASITRQDMMVLTVNALKMLKRLQQQGSAADLQKFVDRSLVATYAKPFVATAVKEGLIVGSGGGKVNPLGNTTRAEAAVFLYRIYCKY
ncbi:MAG TPA: hypothetical protein DDZ53_01555 [Firmicutes bacterium]|nr:hypothetical protein [Bacillota bacterium]